jgi:chitin biosynthesis protein CHS5
MKVEHLKSAAILKKSLLTMLQEASSVQFTVGKIDAGLAILLSPDNHTLEFPSSMLPSKVVVGSIVNVTIERNKEEEQKQLEEFQTLQTEIFQEFSRPPQTPEIQVKKITQTSVIIKWNPIQLYSATFRGIDVYRNGIKLGMKPQSSQTQVKITGLSVGTRYEIYVVLRTTAGSFSSNKLQVDTHTMENLTGLYPCFGAFSNDSDIDTLIELVQRIGASYSDDLTGENTHLVCTLPKGPKYDKALEMNIPIVTPEFLKSCELLGKVQPAHSFYIEKGSN